MRDKMLVFGSPPIERAEIEEVLGVLESGWLGTGPKVSQFENDFALYKGVNNAAALNSCTAALHLSLLAAGIGPGDEVITTPLTFCATVNAIIHSGATPILADIESSTMNIDPAEVKSKITSRTKAILPVHFAGRPCNMDELIKIAHQHKLKIIEDCAHAIETEYHGMKAGTMGHFGCFSFYVTKNIVTGEGGMVITKNEKDASRIKVLGLHGMTKDAWKRFGDEGFKHYQVIESGFKYNMMDLQAAIGIHQLSRVEKYWERRLKIWQRYNDAFKDLPITLPAEVEENTKHAFHLYTILIDEQRCGISRDSFLNRLASKNIGAGVHYLSIPEHPFYQKTYKWAPSNYPNAMNVGRQTISLPLSAKLTNSDIEDVINAVKEVGRNR